jgi:hypothetical protein
MGLPGSSLVGFNQRYCPDTLPGLTVEAEYVVFWGLQDRSNGMSVLADYEELKRLVIEADEDVRKAAGGNKAAGTRARKKMQEVKAAAQGVRIKLLEGRQDTDGAEPAGE